jgi:hypothetical protein
MDLAELQTRLSELGVRPNDDYRAALYIDCLNHAETYFETTLAGTVAAGGLGDDYPFVANALGSANLLQELADILDFYVAPAVQADLRRAYATVANGGLGHGPGPNGWTYAQYFTNVILDANQATFDNNIAAFRGRYPISMSIDPLALGALARLSANFQGNILLACQRIIADKALLNTFYRDLYPNNLVIRSLQKIKSTGSDFHKGGKQVLILTFDIIYLVAYGPPLGLAPSREELKVVYKPSDLEVDCLIAGDSTVVNRVLGVNFMTESLFEIYNRRLQIIKTDDPTFTGEPLTTYRILPRKYISARPAGYPLPIRDAYGYIQYLDYDLSGTAQQVFGYYPFGASDYLIFQSQDSDAIIRSFYRREGALTALCGSFSIIDMHIENVRVMKYQPYLIDLEISLTWKIDDIDQTELLKDAGGITGISIQGQDLEWEIRNPDTPGGASMQERGNRVVYYQNRLWSVSDNRQKEVVDPNELYLLEGFADGMFVLRAGQLNQNNDFAPWFTRLNNNGQGVLVRALPYGTGVFKSIRNAIFINQLKGNNPGATLAATQVAALREKLTAEYNARQQAVHPDPAADPGFVSLTQGVSGQDYLNLDIPVFYHRIGTTDIVNSLGVQVPIPPFVTINTNPVGGTQQAAVTGAGGVLNRGTYFVAPPTQNIVDQGQVQILAGGGFANRENLLTQSIITGLGNIDNVLNPPDKIIGIDD